MFTPSLQPATKPFCGKNRGLLPLVYMAIETATKKPTHSAQHSIFLDVHKKYHSGAIVAAPSFDAELHIETTTIMFADLVESMCLIEPCRPFIRCGIRKLPERIRATPSTSCKREIPTQTFAPRSRY